MADRPSVQEILARVRAAGPATAPSGPQVQSEVDKSDGEAAESVSETSTPTEEPVAAVVEMAPPPTPESLGRPLTLQEKLAAARNRPVSAQARLPAAPAGKRPESVPLASAETVPEVVARPVSTAVATPQLTPEALGRSLTLKEKLAAARGGAAAPAPAAPVVAGVAKPPANAAPASKPASSRTLPPLAQATDPRDLAEHLRRMGAEKEKKAKVDLAAKATSAPAKLAPAKKAESKVVPPRPGRVEAAAAIAVETTATPEPTRRYLLRVGFWIAAGWAAFMASMAAMTGMTLRFFFPNVLAEPPSTIKVGYPADFEKNQVNERFKSEWGFWLVRSDAYDGEDKIYALSSICTHLGCPPNWLPSEQKFKCPCHGSGFYISGVNFEGPAPRPLERYKVTVGDDMQIIVDKSMKFQEELGQWMDPESFIKA